MTLLDDPPGIDTSMPGRRPIPQTGSPGWRLAARLARRETVRRPGRTVLAGLLIAVPVLAMTIGSVLARTETNGWADQFARRYGSADIAVDAGWFGPTSTDSGPTASGDVALPTGHDQRRPTLGQHVGDPGSEPHDQLNNWVTFTDLVLVGDGTGQPIEVVEGRAPRVGEVLLGKRVAKALGVSIGDRLELVPPFRELDRHRVRTRPGQLLERAVRRAGLRP